MSAQPVARITPEQYLEAERKAEFKHEYFDGEVFAMSGGTFPHGTIIGNLTGALWNALKGRSCTVTPNDVRVRVGSGRMYTYPDILVVCGEPRFADDQKDTLLNPTLIIEVLSTSTEAHDRGLKFREYRSLESLQEYALVSQYEPRVEKFRRGSTGDWLMTECAGLEGSCRFDSVNCEIALSEIYYNVAITTI
jgi:Uma2 family endonuclease